MATLGGTALTLADIAKQTDPSGRISTIVEVLSQTNEMLDDIMFEECNDGDSHQTTIRTGLPTGTWRRFNEGVQPSKGRQAQIRAQTAQLESRSLVDRDLADKGGKAPAVRANAAAAEMEGLNQQIATAIFYDDERTNPARFTGLAAHYSSVSTATAASAQNVVDAGGTGGDNASMWLVVWGPNSVHGLYPQGSKAGLTHEDRGVIRATDASGNPYDAYEDVWKWKCGLCVRDWRYVARVCNIDISALVAESGDADLIKAMIKAEERIPSLRSGKAAWYMNRTCREMLRIQRRDGAQYALTLEQVDGRPVLMTGTGIPVRISDALLNTEARLL